MRAVIVNEYGGTPVVAEIPTPRPGSHQVLIKVRASGINPIDRWVASGARRSEAATFPMVLGADGAGIVEMVGEGETRFSLGDRVFGTLWRAAPLVQAGTHAEYVAVSADGPLARVPDGLDFVVAAALPIAGMTGLSLVEGLTPLTGKTVLIVGAGGGVGAFATQFAVAAGARVIAMVRSDIAKRLRGYGAAETVDRTQASPADAVRQGHPDGIDVLIDLAGDADGFSALASLVRRGGSALTTQYVADVEALKSTEVTGINFALQPSPVLLERLANAVVTGQIVAPPITRIALDQVPALLSGAKSAPTDGKTVITL
jgi:NADPH:quinone reductase-like Zn-dependent oxidoreductase